MCFEAGDGGGVDDDAALVGGQRLVLGHRLGRLAGHREGRVQVDVDGVGEMGGGRAIAFVAKRP